MKYYSFLIIIHYFSKLIKVHNKRYIDMSLSRIFTVILVFSFAMLSHVAVAQKNYTAEADEAYRLQKYYEAIPLYKKAFTKVSNRPEKRRILFQIAECYRKTSDFARAEAAYDRAIRADFPLAIVYLRYAETLKSRGKYEEAREAYNKYLEREPGDQRARIARDYCDTAIKWMENPTRWQVENMKRFNSRNNDFSPSYADNKKYNVLVFTSDREEATGKKMDQWTGGKFTDIFYVTLDRKGNWSKPQSFDDDKIINTPFNEGVTAFNDKANILYFTRCRVANKERLGCDIFTSKKMGRKWSEPEPLGIAADSIRVMHPTISEDEKVIYFTSDMPGGYGGGDIWMARRTSKTKPFGTPENLGPVINTSGNEMFPYLRQEGVIYFSSDGHPGMGGLDIFRSVIVNGEWTTPENMGYPINSEGDDFGIILQGLEKRFGEQEDGFISSNRNIKGSRGGDDIYAIHLPPILFTLSGTVRDAQTLQRLQGVKVELKGTDKTAIETTTDRTGMYRFNNQQILPNVTYTIIFSKDGYFGAQGKESTVGLMVSKDLIHNKNLEPIPKDPIVLPEIRYDLAKWDLKEQYQDSLLTLVKTLKDNPTIVVELISHTDFRASHEFNDTLSLKRSRSCVEYIVKEHKIDPDRIIAVGRGEREPRKLDRDYYVPEWKTTIKAGSHLTEEFINGLRTTNEKEAAHQLNRRTEFRIVRNDFVPKDKNVPIDSLAFERFKIAINPEENVIPFYINESGEIAATTVVNGLSLGFVYNEPMKGASMSLEQAMALLRDAWITKGNFTEKDEAILEDGTIKNGAEFRLATVSFGRNMELKNVAVRVSHDQKQNFMVGKELLQTIAPVSVNRNTSQIVFDLEKK
jgi:peptidoglycan-associated lipoprotein